METQESIANTPGAYADFTGYIFYAGTEAHVKQAYFMLVESFNTQSLLYNGAITSCDIRGPGIKWYAGTWLDGLWNDGIWYDGTWANGNFEHGIWCNGTVLDGYFTNALWKNGHFRRGEFFGGVWKSGHAYEDAYIHAFIYDMVLHSDIEHYNSIFTHSSGYRRITLDGINPHDIINNTTH